MSDKRVSHNCFLRTKLVFFFFKAISNLERNSALYQSYIIVFVLIQKDVEEFEDTKGVVTIRNLSKRPTLSNRILIQFIITIVSLYQCYRS